jgi:hypothetical protein
VVCRESTTGSAVVKRGVLGLGTADMRNRPFCSKISANYTHAKNDESRAGSLTSLLAAHHNIRLFSHRRTYQERFVASASSSAPVLHGVAPLRAGQGSSFVLRRLHSLTGIIPVGAFLFEHILISNSTAISGPAAYARQVSFLANLPLVFFLELIGIWLPIAFHAFYGFYIWYRGDGNTIAYPWTGNWM